MKTVICLALALTSISLPLFARGEPLQAKPLSNLQRPTEVIVSFLEHNEEYIEALYRLIMSKNEKDPQNEITLVVSVPDNYGPASMFDERNRPSGEPMENFKQWEAKLKRQLGVKALPSFIMVPDSGAMNPWMQDIGEPMAFRLSGSARYTKGFLDTNYAGGQLSSSSAQSIFKALNIPIYNAKNYADGEGPNDGDRGGNIEATPEGRFFVGSTISPKLLARLEEFSGQKPFVADTSFLLVGHIDEIYSFVPVRDRCGFGLVHADSLAMINLIWSDRGKWENYNISGSRSSIEYFLKAEYRKKTKLTIDHFDLSRPVRKADNGLPSYDDWVIKQNLFVYKKMAADIARLKNEMSCLETVVGLPTVFEYPPEFSLEDLRDSQERSLVPLGSAINHLILGEDLIVKEPFFSKPVRAALERVFRPNNIHFLGDKVNFSEYERNYGSTHCSTMVIRQP